MSYATYLRNKTAAQQKIVNVRNSTDASLYIHKKKLEATQVFFADGSGRGSLAMDTSRPAGTPLIQHAAGSFSKSSGRSADASTYTAYRGHIGIGDDAPYVTGGKKALLCTDIPAVDSSKYKGAGDVTKDKIACDKSNALLDPPRFVDSTIRLSAMHPEMVAEECCNHKMVQANHTHSKGINPPVRPSRANTSNLFMAKTPGFQNPGVGGKRAGAYYNPRSGYVENKHGNDLGVNPARVPTPWIYSSTAPAHLKINRPTHFNIKF